MLSGIEHATAVIIAHWQRPCNLTVLSTWVKLYLPLSVDSDDATGSFVDSSDKDGFTANAVHVDAGAGLNVVQVDVAKLGDQVDDIILLTHLGIN